MASLLSEEAVAEEQKAELGGEQEEDEDVEEEGPNWDLLSSELGAGALAALQAHLSDEAEGVAATPPAVLSTSSTAVAGSEQDNTRFKTLEYWDQRFEVWPAVCFPCWALTSLRTGRRRVRVASRI